MTTMPRRSSNQENMREFVAALRSGKYQQAAGGLHFGSGVWPFQSHSYCCLGVACEVARKHNVVKRSSIISPDYSYDEDGVLPTTVAEWLGIASDPMLFDKESGSEVTATRANDKLKWDFNKIADAFEYTYLTEVDDNGE